MRALGLREVRNGSEGRGVQGGDCDVEFDLDMSFGAS